MPKWIKFLLIGLGIFVLLIGGPVLYISSSGLPRYEEPVPDLTVEVTPEKVRKGLKISSMLCNQCHSGADTRQLVGRKVEDIDPVFGEVYSANITRHAEAGIGAWTDGEFARLIRSGIKKDGTYAPPYMPKFPLMADEDLEAIIAFLRSDHPLVEAHEQDETPCKPSLMTKMLSRVAFKPMPYPKEPIMVPDTNDLIAYGKYLSTARLACYECHSADFKTNTPMEPEKSPGYMGGGNKLLRMNGEEVLSPNISMHEKFGIGRWTEKEFIDAVKWGKKPGGGNYLYPMVPYTPLSDHEVKAIFAYLKTVPALENEVVQPVAN